jgi:hypothetical protein
MWDIIMEIINFCSTTYKFSINYINYFIILIQVDLLFPAIDNFFFILKLIDNAFSLSKSINNPYFLSNLINKPNLAPRSTNTFSLINEITFLYYNLMFNYYATLNGRFKSMIIELFIVTCHLTFLIQVFGCVVISIWARAAGPRFRVDQLSNLTWKNLLIYLSLLLIFLTAIYILN